MTKNGIQKKQINLILLQMNNAGPTEGVAEKQTKKLRKNILTRYFKI